jgi:hypothetical protein
MSNYIFLTENFNEGPTTYYAIPGDKIETLALSDTYDQHGQLIGHTNAGDYHFENSECSAISDCEKEIVEKFGASLIIDTNDDEFKARSFDCEENGLNEAEVNAFIEKWRDENESLTEVEGFTYWDGNNWKTITTSVDAGEPSHILVDDEKLSVELNEAIENKSFEISGLGCEVFSHEKWVIIDSNWQGTWAAYEIMSMEDYQYRQPNSSALPVI